MEKPSQGRVPPLSLAALFHTNTASVSEKPVQEGYELQGGGPEHDGDPKHRP